jgi:ribosome maturation factor RimP
MPPAPAGPSTVQARQHLLDVLGPVVSAEGYDLEDLTVSAAGRRSLVRLIVDRDGGVDLDAVAGVSRAVSDALDADAAGNALPSAYVLEVSSPGVDRPLTEPRHWRRAVGRLVKTQVHGQSVTGRVLAADEHGARLDVKGITREVGWADLGKGSVQVEFSRPGEPEADDTDPDDTELDDTEPDDTEQLDAGED